MPTEAYKYRLSGGASNTDPSLSLGGVESSEQILQQIAAWKSTGFTGLTVVSASGNQVGDGTLRAITATGEFAWVPPGEVYDSDNTASILAVETVDTEISQPLIVPSKGSLPTVTVNAASGWTPPAISSEQEITITNRLNELFPNVTVSEADNGVTKYRGIYIENQSASTKFITMWVGENSSGSDYFEYGIEAADGTMQTIADENTAPTGVTFGKVTRLNIDNQFELGPSASRGIWIKQTIPPLSAVAATPAVFALVLLD